MFLTFIHVLAALAFYEAELYKLYINILCDDMMIMSIMVFANCLYATMNNVYVHISMYACTCAGVHIHVHNMYTQRMPTVITESFTM